MIEVPRCYIFIHYTILIRFDSMLLSDASAAFPPTKTTTMTTIVNDTSEAICLSSEYKVYLKPIAKMTVSVALPHLKLPGKSISNWEVMERVKAMVAPEQFSSLRISKSTLDFIRFEGEVENKMVVKSLLSHLDGKSIKLSGFTDVLKVRLITLVLVIKK